MQCLTGCCAVVPKMANIAVKANPAMNGRRRPNRDSHVSDACPTAGVRKRPTMGFTKKTSEAVKIAAGKGSSIAEVESEESTTAQVEGEESSTAQVEGSAAVEGASGHGVPCRP